MYQFINKVKGKQFNCIGNFQNVKNSFNSKFKIICNDTISFVSCSLEPHRLNEITRSKFQGISDEGLAVSGVLNGNWSINSSGFFSGIDELLIGSLENIKTVKTYLIGFHFSENFSFKFKDFQIIFLKSKISFEEATRIKLLNGKVSKGCGVIIKGKNLDLDKVNELIIIICRFLRPVASSQIYFGQLKCNNKTILFHKNTLIGKLFGYHNYIIESTREYSDYLIKALNKWDSLSDFDKESIIDIGFSLSTSHGCGLQETSLSSVITSLERLGENQINDRIIKKNIEFNKEISKLRQYLQIQTNNYNKKNNEYFNDNQMKAFSDSISRIQPWDDKFISNIKIYLEKNNWNINIDFKNLKKVRDSLSHSGHLPSGYSFIKLIELQRKIEIILIVHILELIDFEGFIQVVKNGWRHLPKIQEIKDNYFEK